MKSSKENGPKFRVDTRLSGNIAKSSQLVLYLAPPPSCGNQTSLPRSEKTTRRRTFLAAPPGEICGAECPMIHWSSRRCILSTPNSASPKST